MNSLEFIEKHIKETQSSIKAFELDYELFHREGDKRDAEKLKQILHHFQQIKAELEAWGEIQGTITEGQDSEGKYCFIETIYFTGESGQKIIKALKNDDKR